ncbi:MAG: glutathione S-transferase N-terminal domain-containing protein [Sandaracinaceae bacterium]|nr:glutathione S-transferase N-terminal domain-containing protein [Sandaracinaceae bacterium]
MGRHKSAVNSSIAASSVRQWYGSMVLGRLPVPPGTLTLFDAEGDADSRLVREALTELDVDLRIVPVPEGGQRHRGALVALGGGSARVPLLHDAGADVVAQGKGAILRHLFVTYRPDDPRVPLRYRFGATSSKLATRVRKGRGLRATEGRPAAQDLELYSFESSPFSRLVRERLTELELAYLLHNLGKEQRADIGPAGKTLTFGKPYAPVPGGKREKLLARGGRIQVPYLIDPNTSTALYESRAILEYLDRTYAR